ncbi:hypothetical protein SCHPADRAFT_869479 [Schizopora paradoxa]|uniref:Phosphatidylserine decarboxylase n=1 Tax=Schizopora paradoxa TaxID=27342 RepID=A0A0H2RYM3_9AGAM|nr:hypothetical protein SCHPADRAFT_869479 [Schizopora paradoxa]
MSFSSNVETGIKEKTVASQNGVDGGTDAKGSTKASSKRGGWGRVFRGKAYEERLSLEESLKMVVTKSESPPSVLVNETSLALSSEYLWLSHLFPAGTVDKLFAKEHLGNYLIVRSTGEKIFETMPIYARIGMHLLFYGPLQIRLLRWKTLRNLLKTESIRQGKIYDSTDPEVVRTQITAFVTTYNINVAELLEPDLKAYKTFNQFFSRRLRPDARPPASPDDSSVIVSCADCRLTVWPNWSLARKIWVKGRHFTLSSLLKDRKLSRSLGKHPSLAIFRLAPQDYHRFHSPVFAVLQGIKHIDGEYYTVNPQAVNEKLDVLSGNVREIATYEATASSANDDTKSQVKIPVAIVAVGALLVGSVGWDKKVGETVPKGDGLGYFQYGGSTVIVVLPGSDVAGMHVRWDDDLVKNSEGVLETLVRAGERIGQFVSKQ